MTEINPQHQAAIDRVEEKIAVRKAIKDQQKAKKAEMRAFTQQILAECKQRQEKMNE